MKLDHVYVETRDFDRALAFWAGLGFEEQARWGDEGHRAGQLVRGEALVVLAECASGSEPQGPTIHFGVEDVDAVAAAVTDAVEVVTPPEDTHWGSRWARIRDADGNLYVLEGPRLASS